MSGNQLQDFRQSIDNIDAAFMFLLAERVRIIIKVGLLKLAQGLSLTYSDERKEALAKTIDLAVDRGIDRDFMRQLFDIVYQESLRMMGELKASKQEAQLDEAFYRGGIEDLRCSLYNVDQGICHALAERFHVVLKVKVYKDQHQLPPLAPGRWAEVVKTKMALAETLGVSPAFVLDILNAVHAEALRLEQ